MKTTETMTSSLTSKEACINALVDAEFALMPLRGQTKVPKLHGWTAIKPDIMQTPDDFPENYGVIIPDSVLVIDVDPRKFQDNKPFEDLKEFLGLKPDQHFDTFTVRSRKGEEGQQDGLHIYFKKPEGISVRTLVNRWPGVEFKSCGSFLVGPGSVHPDTHLPYTAVHGHPSYLLDAPTALLDVLDRALMVRGIGLAAYTDDAMTKTKFKDYLLRAPLAVEGYDGDPTTLKVALVGRDFNLSPEATLELMLTHWNDRCSPPWPADGLQTKVRNAYSYAKGAQGNKHPSAIFDPLPEPPVEDDDPNKGAQMDRRRSEAKHKIFFDGKKNNLYGYDETIAPVYSSFKSSIANIIKFFETPHFGAYHNPLYKLIGFNHFSRRIEFLRPAPWHNGTYVRFWDLDYDLDRLASHFSTYKDYNPAVGALRTAVVTISRMHEFDSAADALNALVWDGVPRLSKLFTYYLGAPDTKYIHAVARTTLIALVARNLRKDKHAILNGVKHDMVPILEGNQGIRKSLFCEILAGEDGLSKVVHIDTGRRDSDNIQQMDGLMVAELAESLFTKRSDIEKVKAFITTAMDRYRAPYGHGFIDVARRSILIATVNPGADGATLVDKTGNRRWNPVPCEYFKIEEFRRDRDQIMAEAVAAFKAGEKHYFTDPEVIAQAEAMQQSRLTSEPWAGVIQEWLAYQEKQGRAVERITATEAARQAVGLSVKDMGPLNLRRVAEAMAELGWTRTQFRDGRGDRVYGFKAPKRVPFDDIEGV